MSHSKKSLALSRLSCLTILGAALLLASPIRAEVVAESHEAPIHLAARLGSGKDIRSQLDADPKGRELRTDLGSTPLHLAAMNPDTSAMLALLKAGADANARDLAGATPLHMAAYASRPVHARILLEHGADPSLKTNEGRDATAMARKVKSDEVAGIISLWILKGCKPGKPC